MKKRLLSIIAAVAVSCAIFFTSNVVKAATLQDRLWGNDRYQTNSKIIDSGWTSSDYAVIASGEGFADALCAAPLAQQNKAPILLTGKETLSTESKNQLLKLKVKKVFIIGGTGVVSDNVKSEIESMGIETTRIYGQDRFETSIEVAKNLKNITGVVVTNGYGFADALSIAPVAAQKGIPILLTNTDDLPSSVKEFLDSSSYSESYIVGGKGVVSDNIASQLNNNKRLGGNSRYETNAVVLNHFADKFSYDKVYVASGENYPDALSGSVLAASSNSPLILTGTSIDSSVMSSVKSQHNKYNNVIVLGGTGVVSYGAANYIVSLSNDNQQLLDGYWKQEKNNSEIISFYPNNKFERISMGGSGGTEWRGTYVFDNNDVVTLTGDGYTYHIGDQGGQTEEIYTVKMNIIDKDTISIYEYGEWNTYARQSN